ncbi:hypothetical protein JTE90_016045 [Oedothorax gibbosus]|uniref:Uncharacterized protein n=1 Tax=Oedothorax gibbosus TaxID=931172 RepID=A0AAV6U5U5_9ARAC|nr:hypothetical protein JTE90_016045 [Oedothorax gibbosus]
MSLGSCYKKFEKSPDQKILCQKKTSKVDCRRVRAPTGEEAGLITPSHPRTTPLKQKNPLQAADGHKAHCLGGHGSVEKVLNIHQWPLSRSGLQVKSSGQSHSKGGSLEALAGPFPGTGCHSEGEMWPRHREIDGHGCALLYGGLL